MNESEYKSLMCEYLDYYSRTEIVFEIVKQLYGRETVFIDPFDKSKATRLMKIHSIQDYGIVTKWVGFWKRPYNIYYSLAKYKQGIPYQVLNHDKRKELNKEWNEVEHWKNIDTFDFLIDFDGEDWKHAEQLKPDVLKVSELLKDVPHSIRFSGCGFHIIVPGQYMPQGLSYDPELETSYFTLLHDLLTALQRNYCGYIDLACTDSRRVVKIPYSLACYEEGAYVCYPYFKHSEISEILIPQFTTSWILSSTASIRNRGVPVLNLERVNDADPSAAMRKVCSTLLGNKWKKYEKLINNDCSK